MNYNSRDGEFQLVLDNRKLIIAFVVLILVCGCFFVIGFMEGGRQGNQQSGDSLTKSPAAPADSNMLKPPMKSAAAGSGTDAAGDKAVREKLDWYGSVNQRGIDTKKAPEPAKTASTQPAPTAVAIPAKQPGEGRSMRESKPSPPAAATVARVTYSVQVGAFRQRKDADSRAAILRSKGYECAIESPRGPNKIFQLKVGNCESRAEAVALQNRLKKDGFTTFIKTNK